ncbi:TPA: hypothetical protein ACXN34_007888 [Burkholderia cepacia]|uniref:hypothetical protein n=1 Tax=Burkholderia pyrrocinia TaxID=60550 RepID=UPI0005027C81|nr:hypothetical protein [Burkholderia pyrrocinia]KFL49344.1 hypothetical protein JM78_34680 [Burkholderia pyrrocinia]
MSTIEPCPFAHRLRRRIAAADLPGKLRAGWHLVLTAAAFSLGWRLFLWGNWERAAARAGDPHVLAVRRAIREALKFADAVSVLEHALSGIGMAAVGVGALQFYYYVFCATRGSEPGFPRWGKILLFVLIASAAVTFTWSLIYGRTGPLVVPAGLFVIGWWLARPDHWSHLALRVPGAFIALIGGLVWLNFDLAWKVSEWPTTHDTVAVVLAHLLASAATLITCSIAAGAAVRRCAWLRPASAGGQ